MKNKISIIMGVYNKADVLENALDSLKNQDIENSEYELIVVDNNSTDGSAELAKKYCEKVSNFRFIHEKKQGLSHSRNAGVEISKYNILAFFDDDAIAPQSWVRMMLEIFDEYNPEIVAGPIYPYYTSSYPKWFLDEYEIRKHQDSTGYVKDESRGYISGSNFAIKKNVLNDQGNFNPDLGMKGQKMAYSEEVEIYNKVLDSGGKAYYSLDLKVKHHVPKYKLNILYFLSKFFNQGADTNKLSFYKKEKFSIEKYVKLVLDTFADIEFAMKKDSDIEDHIISETRSKIFRLGQLSKRAEGRKLSWIVKETLESEYTLSIKEIITIFLSLFKKYLKQLISKFT